MKKKSPNYENFKGIVDVLQAISIVITLFLVGVGIYQIVSGGFLEGILNIVLGLFIYGLFYAIFRLTKEVGILKDKVEELESTKKENKN